MGPDSCVERDDYEAFKEVVEHFPEIMLWVLTCYGSEAELIFGNTVIMSRTGFHQGDPLASLLFSLALKPIVRMIVEQVPTTRINTRYLDDGGVAGKVEELKRVVDIVKVHGPPRGLFPSTADTSPKSIVWSPSGETLL